VRPHIHGELLNLIRDPDTAYGPLFVRRLRAMGIRGKPIIAVAEPDSCRAGRESRRISLGPGLCPVGDSARGSLARRRAADSWRAFADHAAGDAIAGIPGGIAHVVVLASVDHCRGAALMEHRIGLAFVERDRRIEHLEFERACRRDV
jgi:hypothetical protein